MQFQAKIKILDKMKELLVEVITWRHKELRRPNKASRSKRVKVYGTKWQLYQTCDDVIAPNNNIKCIMQHDVVPPNDECWFSIVTTLPNLQQ